MATTAATATQHQCSAVTVQTLPPAAGVDGTLVTAHQLLNNSSSVHASPSAAEQWCHDVDQLIVAAINTLHHEECDKSRRQRIRDPPSSARAPPSARVPHQARVLPSIATTDLRDEFIRRPLMMTQAYGTEHATARKGLQCHNVSYGTERATH
jgi:hypothetical protein